MWWNILTGHLFERLLSRTRTPTQEFNVYQYILKAIHDKLNNQLVEVPTDHGKTPDEIERLDDTQAVDAYMVLIVRYIHNTKQRDQVVAASHAILDTYIEHAHYETVNTFEF